MTRPAHNPYGRLVYAAESPMKPIVASLERVARSRAPVLVTGESGTGKEGVVRLIHDLAPWSGGPFVPVNCAAIPATLLESELFGHVRGAFTGADRNRVGRFEAASGGTLFLDEIGETAPELQVKLLRVLQDQVFVPVGGSVSKRADVRVVAATNIDVSEAVRSGRFREDLFFRLDVVRIELPALRHRPADIAPLARHFVAHYAATNLSRVEDITEAALDELMRHAWPGNVRELENVIQSILVLKESGSIEADDVRMKLGVRLRDSARGPRGADLPPPASRPLSVDGLQLALPDEGLVLKDTLDRLERGLIREALSRAQGNRARAATLLGLNRTTLVEKLRRMPGGDAARPEYAERAPDDGEVAPDLLRSLPH